VVVRSGLRSPSSAPILALISASMSSRAIQATLSRSTSVCSSWSSLSASWAAVILWLSAIVVSPSSLCWNRPTIMRPAVAELTSGPPACYTTLRDSTDQQAHTEIYEAIQQVLDDYDLLVTPTLACLPVDNAEDGNTVGPSRINDVEVDPLIGWCLTYFVNFSGHPAASIPAGLAEDRLPVGMQLIGRRHADADVLAASAAFERIRPWQHTYQLCTNRPL
jgi:hypothetical protein